MKNAKLTVLIIFIYVGLLGWTEFVQGSTPSNGSGSQKSYNPPVIAATMTCGELRMRVIRSGPLLISDYQSRVYQVLASDFQCNPNWTFAKTVYFQTIDRQKCQVGVVCANFGE